MVSAEILIDQDLRFDNANGGTPYRTLLQGTDGAFYGTSYFGGHGYDGTVFKITLAGADEHRTQFLPGMPRRRRTYRRDRTSGGWTFYGTIGAVRALAVPSSA